MCLFGRSRPYWEDEVVFSNRKHPRHRTHVTETTVRRHSSQQYIESPPSPPPPVMRPMTPPLVVTVPIHAPSPPPPPSPARIELVSVEEDLKSVRSSRAGTKKSRHGGSSRGGEEVYIEREREVQRRRPSPIPQVVEKEPYDTYRYVPGVAPEREERRRSRSITYESSPRVSGRLTERERVVIEDDGRRREYYRRP